MNLLFNFLFFNDNNKKSNQYIYEDLENTFSSVARYIAPEIPYYSVVSGGIDSSTLAYISK